MFSLVVVKFFNRLIQMIKTIAY